MLKGRISRAKRCRLVTFKRMATTLKERLPGIVRGMLDGHSNAYVEAMNGMLQQTRRAARGFRTAKNFVAMGLTPPIQAKTSHAKPFASRRVA
jgi:transposase